MTNSSHVVSKKVKRQLVKRAGADGISIIKDLFARLEPGKTGTPAASFRVTHEDKLTLIQKLVRQDFLQHRQDVFETYQLRLLGLVIVDEVKAIQLQEICDRILKYMAERFRQDPDNKDNRIQLVDIASAVEHPAETIVEALQYLNNTPALGARSADFPNGNDAYLLASEQSLTYKSLEPLVAQLSAFVGASVVTPITFSEYPNTQSTRYDRIVSFFKDHSITAPILVLLIAVSWLSVVVAAIVYLVEVGVRWFG